MPPRRRDAHSLGELEAAVLEALWDHGELSTPDVHEVVGEPRGLAYTTILTVLQRLTKKGLVRRSAGGRSHVHAPTLSREEFANRRAESLAGMLVEIGTTGVGAFLAEARRLDPEVIETLRQRLEAEQ
jgi:predicted transcriptional regulator